MDGNGRWAKKNSLQIREGHAKGVSALKEIVKESINQKIESLTVYACLLYTSPSPRDRH